jgi:hypothetical protein
MQVPIKDTNNTLAGFEPMIKNSKLEMAVELPFMCTT